MNEIVNFFLPLTFGHIFYVALIIIGAIICARIAWAVMIYVGTLLIGLLGLIVIGLASIFNRPKKHVRRR